jgi:hypothetical protein
LALGAGAKLRALTDAMVVAPGDPTMAMAAPVVMIMPVAVLAVIGPAVAMVTSSVVPIAAVVVARITVVAAAMIPIALVMSVAIALAALVIVAPLIAIALALLIIALVTLVTMIVLRQSWGSKACYACENGNCDTRYCHVVSYESRS